MSTERLFRTHEIRKQESLEGIWDFQTTDGTELPEEYTDRTAVPSCWEMNIKYGRYSGYAAYRRKVNVEQDGNVRLLFKGISHSGTIFWDGAEIGFHYNAYTPFSLVVPGVKKGEHVLEAVVDNHFSEKSALHIPNDYFTYGGITRPVFWEMVPDLYIERTEFEPAFTDGRWTANVRIFIKNISEWPRKAEIKAECAGVMETREINIDGNTEAEVRYDMSFEGAEAWNHENPCLYFLKCQIWEDGKAVDDLIDRVGFRTVSVKGHQILINGEPVFLKGVNRHEDHGICGCAMPLQLLDADIKLILEAGCNAVRTSHYPNDERFLDLCDEYGIYVWEESHARGGDVQRITNPLFIEQSMKVMHEMMEYHYNHPGIIIWACLNEMASNKEEGAKVYKQHLDYLAEDKSRLHTFASMYHTDDLCQDMVDVSSFNMYPYWYTPMSAAEFAQKTLDHIRETGNGHKPLIISEYGGGAIYGFHDVMQVKWSEEYQAELLEKTTTELMQVPEVAGLFIWQFCDTRVSQDWPQNWPMSRPKSRNNKGLVDEYRRPKMGYYAIQKIWRE